MPRSFCLLLLLSTLSAVPAEADDKRPPLERLFLTKEQRLELDYLRSRDSGESAAEMAEEEPPPVPNYISCNGVVLRSSGPNTVWINNSSKPAAGLRVNTHQLDGIEVPVFIVNGSREIRLKPGQRLNTLTNQTEESYRR